MIRNYFKTAIRNLLKNRTFTFINISGLSIGMASVFLILLFIRNELSYDKFYTDADDIYRIAWASDNPQTRTPHPMPLAMVRDFPEVIEGTSLSPLWAPGLTRETFAVRNPENNIRFDEKGILSVDSTFLKVFSFNMLKGNPETVLKNPNLLVLTQSTAKKYFGDEDPIGKFLVVTDDDSDHSLEIGGIIQDVPENSHFHFDFLVSYVTLKSPGDLYYSWDDFGHYNYVKLRHGTDPKQMEDKLMKWVAGYMNMDDESLQRVLASHMHFMLQPLTKIHLESHIRWELEPNGNISYIYIMGSAAIFILLIACVNFMNLTSAKSNERIKEIGIRKSLGSSRIQQAFQFIGETVLIALISLLLSGFLVELSLPWFNSISGRHLFIDYVNDLPMVFSMLGVGLLVGILSGLYPALVVAAYKPHLILKGEVNKGRGGNRLRQLLVVFQFGTAMILISGSIIIYKQLDFVENSNLGFNKDQVMVVPIHTDKMREQLQTIKNELLKIEGVSLVSAVSNVPGTSFNQNPVFLTKDEQNRVDVSEFRGDVDVFNTLGIKLKEGRLFGNEFTTDSTSSFVINEAAARALSPDKSVVGEELTWDADGMIFKGTIVGVVGNFRFQSLHQPIRPVIFQMRPSTYNDLLIKIKPDDLNNQVAQIEKIWTAYDGDFEFHFSFLDQTIDNQYRAEQRMGKVFSGFSFLAIIISAMGLFALASLLYIQRQKEVGIRKVLGAQPVGLIIMLLKNFTIMVSAGIIIAIPFAIWIMRSWLENFNARIGLSPLYFIGSALAIILIAWLTVGYLTFRTARSNPVKVLRTE